MARTKSTNAPSIEETIAKKIESIRSQIAEYQEQLDHWEKISNDYQVNKVTIESILSVHNAPDVTEKQSRTRKKSS